MNLPIKQLLFLFGAGIGLLITNWLFAAEAKIAVGQIIGKETAEAILEGPVKVPSPRNVDGKDGYYSKCNYYAVSGGRALIIRLHQGAAGFDPNKELDEVADNSGSMRSISGLGDKARMSHGTESGLPSHVVMLYVIKGNSLITVGLSGFDGDAAGEKVKSVAQKILSQL
jgi:hypothetical protein